MVGKSATAVGEPSINTIVSDLAATPSGSAARRKGNRKYRGLTCASCRVRKVRCEGSQPTCKTCEAYNDTCRYDKAPPLSQIVSMAKRLQEAESTIEKLRTGREGTSVPPASASSHDDLHEEALPTHAATWNGGQNPDAYIHDGTGPTIGTRPTTFPAETMKTNMPSLPLQTHNRRSSNMSRPMMPLASHSGPSLMQQDSAAIDLSLDQHGELCYYGPTSALHDPPELDAPSPRSSAYGSVSTRNEVRDYLLSHAKESSIWEQFALGNAARQTGMPQKVMTKLLQLHFTWVAPMFMWVYRPAFMRDMTTGGTYYSEFLLSVLCAHSSKYQDGQYSELLLTRVRNLLGLAIQQPSSIPTVQALLQFSARELAQGSISQAWVYSGIAFRMATDLGLQHNGSVISTLKSLSPVDLEVRRRLFWSCYFWDKAISMYTGRLPALTDLPHTSLDFVDETSETETWSPYNGESFSLTKLPPGQYPPMRSHAVSCFANSCKISVIINDIILQLYSRRDRHITESSLHDIRARLDTWRAQSPPHLKYDPDNLPAVSPPPHIITQNLLYFTTVILAHRPFWSIPAYYNVCISAARSIEKLILLLELTFGLDNITYLMGYCIYTGASAILEDAKKADGAANATMQNYLRALNAGMSRCPLLERSLHIIIKGLKQTAPSRYPDDTGQPDTAMFNSYIPAFPYLDPGSTDNINMDMYFDVNNLDPMAMLDCFPELQTDFSEYAGQHVG